jgi:hypothetical protein
MDRSDVSTAAQAPRVASLNAALSELSGICLAINPTTSHVKSENAIFLQGGTNKLYSFILL